jgi:alkanesulfonate monooxygenase SsuD/methylene tetrahydromethanopterin reductase-like flavin-dependent oxidoreductase (luciferase family)
MRGMAERVLVMKRIWSGEKVTDSVAPVGPAPAQQGGPQLLVGAIGPKTVRSASSWADGLTSATMDLDPTRQNELFDVARKSWALANKPKPHLATSIWFALDRPGHPDAARAQIHRHLRHYMNWIPTEYVDAMAPTTGLAGSEDELIAALRRFADVGTDEVHLIPTSSNLNDVRRVAAAIPDVMT